MPIRAYIGSTTRTVRIRIAERVNWPVVPSGIAGRLPHMGVVRQQLLVHEDIPYTSITAAPA